MFSTAHAIFILISSLLVLNGVLAIRGKKPALEKMIKVCFFLSLVSEAVKVLSVIEIIPVVEPAVENGALIYRETGAWAPYLQTEHLPLELCSLQILFMFLFLVIKNRRWRTMLLAVMYGTSIIGGVMAVVFASIAPEFETAAAFFSAPRAWQFFLYHSMIIVLGIAIGMDREYELHFKDVRYALAGAAGLDCISFYVNSAMSIPYYQGDTLVGMGYAVNFFSSYNNPLGIVMTDKSQYFLYLLIRLALAVLLILLVFLPFALRDRKKR